MQNISQHKTSNIDNLYYHSMANNNTKEAEELFSLYKKIMQQKEYDRDNFTLNRKAEEIDKKKHEDNGISGA